MYSQSNRKTPLIKNRAVANSLSEKKAFNQSNKISRPTSVAQFRPRPILANEKDLLADSEKVMLGVARTRDQNLIDTTYDDIGKNLLLDLNMQFEEELQEKIEHSGYFNESLKDVVDVIHGTNQIRSLDNDSSRETTKVRRTDSAIRKIQATQGNLGITKRRLKQGSFSPNLLVQNPDPEIRRMNVGYVKLVKMLETQVPYFGGSVEYAKSVKNSFEYWIYHLSTLTKDPDRSYTMQESGSNLLKPMRDYRTHKGLVPLHNQRNLGTGIVEAEWRELPRELKAKLLTGVNQLITVWAHNEEPGNQDAWYALFNRQQKFVELENSVVIGGRGLRNGEMDLTELGGMWDLLDEDGKKSLYGDVLQIPWSGAHLHYGETWDQWQSHESLKRESRDFSKLPYKRFMGLENVVGVKGNILETPEVAGDKYLEELQTKFPSELVPQHYFEGYKGDINTRDIDGYVFRHYFTIESIVDEFKEKHQDWYDSARMAHKPIIGGISGHTLGYLNLYSDAQMRYGDFDADWPHMEVLRAIMLGALIGNKRHHSYDEVMAASDGMPYRTSYGRSRLNYFFSLTYDDVLDSDINQIKSVAEDAKTNTRLNGITTRNTVAYLIMELTRWDRYIINSVRRIIARHCQNNMGLPSYGELHYLGRLITRRIRKLEREGRL